MTGCSGGSCRASSARWRRRSCSSSRCSCRRRLQRRRRRPLPRLLVLCSAGLLFTLSRSSLVALAGGFVVLAVARPALVAGRGGRVLRPASGVALRAVHVCRAETHFFPQDLPYQEEQAREHGGLPGGGSLALNPGEPSLRSHWRNLRDGIETVFHHPQGYGLGNAGATASRFGVPLRAGESNYTEIGVETGLRRRVAVHRVEPRAALRALRCRASPRRDDRGRRRWSAALAAILASPCRPTPTACPGSRIASGGSAAR